VAYNLNKDSLTDYIPPAVDGLVTAVSKKSNGTIEISQSVPNLTRCAISELLSARSLVAEAFLCGRLLDHFHARSAPVAGERNACML
jgi:hypothetical protein